MQSGYTRHVSLSDMLPFATIEADAGTHTRTVHFFAHLIGYYSHPGAQPDVHGQWVVAQQRIPAFVNEIRPDHVRSSARRLFRVFEIPPNSIECCGLAASFVHTEDTDHGVEVI